MEIALNAALKTADAHKIYAAIDAAIHTRNNIKELAMSAGVDRSTLYRAFRGPKGPKLDVVIRVLGVLGFQFAVKLDKEPPKNRPNRFAPPGKSLTQPELHSNPRLVADFITRAFKTSEIDQIVQAFSDTLRAQENIVAFSGRTIRARSSLYRAFTAPHIPKFSTVLIFLHALGLRLAVEALPSSVRDQPAGRSAPAQLKRSRKSSGIAVQ